MSSVNKVILIGNLGADPEMKTMPSGVSMARLRIATTDVWKDKATGQKQERTEWHTVVCFDGLAGICERYLTKGKQVYIEGALSTRTWEDKDTGQKRYATEIKAREMKMLGSGGGKQAESGESKREAGADDDDDLPF